MFGPGALRLDFHADPVQRRRRGAAFVVLALLLTIIPLGYFQHVRQMMLELRQESAALAQQSSLPAVPMPVANREDGSDKLLRQVNVPWNILLDGLEAATGGKVVLLTLQPNARQGEAVLGGEAARYAEVLEYIERLKAQPGFGQVFLTNHEVAEDAPGRPVRFTIGLKWERMQ